MKTILKIDELVIVDISDGGGFIAIHETDSVVYLTVDELAEIAEAVAKHLEEDNGA